MDPNFWAQACNAAVSRPVSALRQSHYLASAVAVSHSRCQIPCRLLMQLSDFHLRIWCRVQRGILLAGLQAAAVEAERERGGRRPRVEEPAAVQRLDVRWLRGGRCRV